MAQINPDPVLWKLQVLCRSHLYTSQLSRTHEIGKGNGGTGGAGEGADEGGGEVSLVGGAWPGRGEDHLEMARNL